MRGEEGGWINYKKFPASACWDKKIACSTNEIEKNKAISSFLGGLSKSQQNCNHAR